MKLIPKWLLAMVNIQITPWGSTIDPDKLINEKNY